MLLYYITDRSQFPGGEDSRRSQLLATIAQAARYGVHYIQLRERDLSSRDLETLARTAIRQVRTENRELKTGLLLNSRTDIALACGASGVHLRSDDISPLEVRNIWTQAAGGAPVTIGKSCHTRTEVGHAAKEGADFVVFGPVFEKDRGRPAGLEGLHEACQEKIPVLALGGISLENAKACMQAGAAGVAGIRLFQENRMDEVVRALRSLDSSRQSSAQAKTDTLRTDDRGLSSP